MPKKTKKQSPGLVKEKIVMGGYGHKAAAEAAAADFLRPSVFVYQSAYFPSPVQFDVEVVITNAKAVELKKPTVPLYPWTVEMTVSVKGKRAQGWMQSFKDMTRGIRL